MDMQASSEYPRLLMPLFPQVVHRPVGVIRGQLTVAMHFNSMAIGVGKRLISMVVRQGWLSLKYSAYKRLNVWKSRFMSTKNTVTSTSWDQLLPLASKMDFTFAKTL